MHDTSSLQSPLLDIFLIRLYLISNLEACPTLKPHATFVTLSHFGDIFLHVLEGIQEACMSC